MPDLTRRLLDSASLSAVSAETGDYLRCLSMDPAHPEIVGGRSDA